MSDTKTCTKCKQEKPVSEFSPARQKATGKTYVSSYCKVCSNKIQREYYKNNRETILAKQKLKRNRDRKKQNDLQRNYGITLSQYEILLEWQNFECAPCGEKHTVKKPLCVDHDHDTDFIRGLLCRKCNRTIGIFGDSAFNVSVAAEYLNDGDRLASA